MRVSYREDAYHQTRFAAAVSEKAQQAQAASGIKGASNSSGASSRGEAGAHGGGASGPQLVVDLQFMSVITDGLENLRPSQHVLLVIWDGSLLAKHKVKVHAQ